MDGAIEAAVEGAIWGTVENAAEVAVNGPLEHLIDNMDVSPISV